MKFDKIIKDGLIEYGIINGNNTIVLIKSGANVTLAAKYLGHIKIEEILNTYSHMFSTALDSVVSVIDSLEDN